MFVDLTDALSRTARRPRRMLLGFALSGLILTGCASPYHPPGQAMGAGDSAQRDASQQARAGQAGPSGSQQLTPSQRELAQRARSRPAAVARDNSPESALRDDQPENLPVVKRRVGEATYYASYFEGRPTASGETYRAQAMTAAHKTLPFGTRVRVVDVETGDSAVVRINDRGPFVPGRIIDLSERAAEEIGFTQDGTAEVQLQVLQP